MTLEGPGKPCKMRRRPARNEHLEFCTGLPKSNMQPGSPIPKLPLIKPLTVMIISITIILYPYMIITIILTLLSLLHHRFPENIIHELKFLNSNPVKGYLGYAAHDTAQLSGLAGNLWAVSQENLSGSHAQTFKTASGTSGFPSGFIACKGKWQNILFKTWRNNVAGVQT